MILLCVITNIRDCLQQPTKMGENENCTYSWHMQCWNGPGKWNGS